jgi:ADP-ribosyl-[dinitrogen reductase] hydrolase
MIGQALLASRGEPAEFQRALARRLRWWLLGLPAGVGLATLRAAVKLWLGFPPNRSGVCSAGNGPAMRSAILGVCAGDDHDRLREWVRTSSRLTHTDPRAEGGALIVALSANYAATHGSDVFDRHELLAKLRTALDPGELLDTLDDVEDGLDRGIDAARFARDLRLDKGVSGFVLHTVPVALFCWLRQPHDFRAAVEDVILLGGDTDTTGAIVGGMAGAAVGASCIPPEWLGGIAEWPCGTHWMRELARRLALCFGANDDTEEWMPVPFSRAALTARNALFIPLVLAHGLRRLLPPY